MTALDHLTVGVVRHFVVLTCGIVIGCSTRPPVIQRGQITCIGIGIANVNNIDFNVSHRTQAEIIHAIEAALCDPYTRRRAL